MRGQLKAAMQWRRVGNDFGRAFRVKHPFGDGSRSGLCCASREAGIDSQYTTDYIVLFSPRRPTSAWFWGAGSMFGYHDARPHRQLAAYLIAEMLETEVAEGR